MIEGWQRTSAGRSRARELFERIAGAAPLALGISAFCGIMLLALWIADNAINK